MLLGRCLAAVQRPVEPLASSGGGLVVPARPMLELAGGLGPGLLHEVVARLRRCGDALEAFAMPVPPEIAEAAHRIKLAATGGSNSGGSGVPSLVPPLLAARLDWCAAQLDGATADAAGAAVTARFGGGSAAGSGAGSLTIPIAMGSAASLGAAGAVSHADHFDEVDDDGGGMGDEEVGDEAAAGGGDASDDDEGEWEDVGLGDGDGRAVGVQAAPATTITGAGAGATVEDVAPVDLAALAAWMDGRKPGDEAAPHREETAVSAAVDIAAAFHEAVHEDVAALSRRCVPSLAALAEQLGAVLRGRTRASLAAALPTTLRLPATVRLPPATAGGTSVRLPCEVTLTSEAAAEALVACHALAVAGATAARAALHWALPPVEALGRRSGIAGAATAAGAAAAPAASVGDALAARVRAQRREGLAALVAAAVATASSSRAASSAAAAAASGPPAAL